MVPSGSFTLAPLATVFQQLAKRMEVLPLFVQKSFLKVLNFPDLEGLNLAIAMLGNFFAERTVEAAEAVVRAGGDFSIENPRWSLLWCTIWIRRLMREARTFQVDFDQCAFGAASMKPTRILMSHQRLQAGLARKCPGNHVHEVLKGKVWSDQFGKVVFRTKLAQVYSSYVLPNGS